MIILGQLTLYFSILLFFSVRTLFGANYSGVLDGTNTSNATWAVLGTFGLLLIAYGIVALVAGLVPALWWSRIKRWSNRWRIFALLSYNAVFIAYWTIHFAIKRPGLAEEYLARNAIPLPHSWFIWITKNINLEAWQIFGGLAFLALLSPAIWRHKRVACALVLLGVSFSALQSRPWSNFSRKEARPNLLIIGIDSLRPDRLSVAGYSRPTPHFDSFISESVFFRRAYVSVARTVPSWTSILTGTYPEINGIEHMFPGKSERAIFVPQLVRSLHEGGYKTAVISDYAGDMFRLLDFGFDLTDTPDWFSLGSLIGREMVFSHFLPMAILPAKLLEFVLPMSSAFPENADPFVLADRIEHFVKKASRSEDPYFVVGFFSSTHLPYSLQYPYYRRYADPGYDGKRLYTLALPELSSLGKIGMEVGSAQEKAHISDLYDEAVSETDDAFGAMMGRLEKSGALKNTIVVLLSDHGDFLYERPRLLGHGTWLGEEDNDIRMLLAMRVPRQYARVVPQQVNDLVRSIDIAPTLLSLLNQSVPQTMQGIDLIKAFADPAGVLRLPSLSAYVQTDISLNSKNEWAGMGAIEYPNIRVLLDAEPESPGYITLKPEYRFMIRQTKWRLLIQDDSRLRYVPGPNGARFDLFPRRDKPKSDLKQADMELELKKLMLMEPAAKIGTNGLLFFNDD